MARLLAKLTPVPGLWPMEKTGLAALTAAISAALLNTKEPNLVRLFPSDVPCGPPGLPLNHPALTTFCLRAGTTTTNHGGISPATTTLADASTS